MLYLVGLGLGDPSDITLKGLEIVKRCEHVYLESYTSIMPSTSIDQMVKLYCLKKCICFVFNECINLKLGRILL
jgi:diphthamide biosynthesis methyltransferase